MLGIKYLLGLDLGQQNDYSVLSVLEVVLRASYKSTYILRYLHRYPLKTDYTVILDDVRRSMESKRIKGKSLLLVDYSGVGRPVLDLFRSEGLSPLGITIVGGKNSRWVSPTDANVCKSDLVSSLQVVFQSKRIKVPSNVKHLELLKQEFLGFRARIKKTGNTTFEAKGSSLHDDIVMSIGLVLWYAEFACRKGRGIKVIGGN